MSHSESLSTRTKTSQQKMKSRIAPNDIEMHTQVTPRVIRHRDAPAYLGMDRNRFDAEVRPGVTEVAMGQRGIAFDRLELSTQN